MAALLAPFGNCVDVLNPTVVSPILSEGMKMAVAYVKNLEDSDFKDKVILHLHEITVYKRLELFVVIIAIFILKTLC